MKHIKSKIVTDTFDKELDRAMDRQLDRFLKYHKKMLIQADKETEKELKELNEKHR
jgi:hypothetical protein